MKWQNQKNAVANAPEPAFRTFWMLALLASLCITPALLVILFLALGWQILVALGSAVIIFVALSVAREVIHDARHRIPVSRNSDRE